jgi:CelD/BcsL family acetyltransferase involved in cellulose biosynthesis
MATRELPERDASATTGSPAGGGGEGTGGWRLEQVTELSGLERLTPAWTELFRASGTANPFAHPAWLRTWAEHFVDRGDLRVVAVWERDRLVALAPLYRHVSGPGPFALRRLRLLGAGRDPLTELAQVLALPSVRRRAIRAIVAHLHREQRDWDWIEIFVPPDHGWLEPETVPAASGSFVTSLFPHACVIVALPQSWEELQRGLKRNVKESIRRSRNRLERDGHQWAVRELREPGQVAAGLSELLELHRARAAMTGRAPRQDRLADPGDEAFTREAATNMAAEGQASIHLLDVDGAAAGGLLVLHAPGTLFLSLSGNDPRWWEYGILNLLTAEVLKAGIRDGARSVNLSSGPETTKLRWSEQIEVHQLFAIVSGRRRSRMAFAAYVQGRAGREVRAGHRVARAVASEQAATEPPATERRQQSRRPGAPGDEGPGT